MFNKKLFRERLTQLRENEGLSARKLASLLGLSQSAIGQFERGATLPALDTLVSMANYFGVTTDYLVGISDTPFPLSDKVINIISQANNPEEIIAAIQELSRSENNNPADEQPGSNEINDLIKDLDNDSIIELRKYADYLKIRQTLDKGNNESSAGLDTAGNN